MISWGSSSDIEHLCRSSVTLVIRENVPPPQTTWGKMANNTVLFYVKLMQSNLFIVIVFIVPITLYAKFHAFNPKCKVFWVSDPTIRQTPRYGVDETFSSVSPFRVYWYSRFGIDLDSQGSFSRGEVILVGLNLSRHWFRMALSFNQFSFTERLGLFFLKGGPAAPNLLPDNFPISIFELTHWAGFCTAVGWVNSLFRSSQHSDPRFQVHY